MVTIHPSNSKKLSLALIEIYEKLSSLPTSTHISRLGTKQHAKCTVDVLVNYRLEYRLRMFEVNFTLFFNKYYSIYVTPTHKNTNCFVLSSKLT